MKKPSATLDEVIVTLLELAEHLPGTTRIFLTEHEGALHVLAETHLFPILPQPSGSNGHSHDDGMQDRFNSRS